MLKRLLFTLLFLIPMFTYSQDVSEEDLISIEKEISASVEKVVSENVTPLLIAEKLGMPFPPKIPKRKVSDIEGEVAEKVMASVDEKYPNSIVVKHRKDALKKYVVHKKGEEVTIRVKPTGRAAVVSGIFKGFNRKGELMIGGVDVPKVDMTEDVMVHFDEELSKKKIIKYVDNKLYYYYEDRKKMKERITPVLQKKIFKSEGYYFLNDSYVPGAEFLKHAVQTEKEKHHQKMLELLTKFTYKKHGYMKKDGKWTLKPEEPTNFLSKKEKTVKKEPDLKEKVKESTESLRKREPLFDSSFYDADFD